MSQRRSCRQGEREDGAGTVRTVGGEQVSAVRQRDLPGDGQAQASALGLGREKWLEQMA